MEFLPDAAERREVKEASQLQAPSVEDYIDFRALLADFFAYKQELTKADLRPYSYSMFSAAADIKSPNYLRMIIDGRRNLSEEMMVKFARAMGMNKAQTEEFKLLVRFGQESEPGRRNIFLKDLSEFRFRRKVSAGEIDSASLERFPNWIGWMLYAILDLEVKDFSPSSLRELLRGKASADEIQDALANLIKLNRVEVDPESGVIRKKKLGAESQEEVPVALVRNLQSQLMYLGLESLFQDSGTEREFGTATLALTQAEFDELRLHLRKFRKQVQLENDLKRETSKGTRVYQLNLQLFPVSKGS